MFYNSLICFLTLTVLSALLASQASSRDDSFVVHANYGIQSDQMSSNSQPVILHEQYPNGITQSKGGQTHYLQESSSSSEFQPIPFAQHSPHFGYQLHRINEGNKNSNVTRNFLKTNVNDLQNVMKNLLQGKPKIHQIIKIPAMYEIHLQEQEKQENKNAIELTNYPKFIDSSILSLSHFGKGIHIKSTPFNPKPFYKRISTPVPSRSTVVKHRFATNLPKIALRFNPTIPRRFYYVNRRNNGKFSRNIYNRDEKRLMNGFRTEMRNNRQLLMPFVESRYLIHVKEKPSRNIVTGSTVIL